MDGLNEDWCVVIYVIIFSGNIDMFYSLSNFPDFKFVRCRKGPIKCIMGCVVHSVCLCVCVCLGWLV